MCVKAKVQIVTLTWFRSLSHLETKACFVLRSRSSSTVLCLSQSRQIDVLHPRSCEWLAPCALLEKLLSSHIFFFFHRQTGKCGQRRSGHGAAWGMEALPCVCPWRYSFWHTVGGLRLQTRQHDSLETQDQTERFAFRVLILLRNKLLLWCVGAWGNSEDDEWSYSWATAQWPQKNIPVDVFLLLFTVRWAYELFEALLNVKL